MSGEHEAGASEFHKHTQKTSYLTRWFILAWLLWVWVLLEFWGFTVYTVLHFIFKYW